MMDHPVMISLHFKQGNRGHFSFPSTESVEDKLDEDFLFYLSFTKSNFGNLIEKQDVDLCQAWLQKLCGETVSGVEAKRCRNVYLSQLVLNMQEGQLRGPFLEPPPGPDGQLAPASSVFGPVQPDIQEPPWLEEVVEGSSGDFAHTSRDGRTYLATRSLPEGQGAFGYMAVTVAENEPLWLGGGEGQTTEGTESSPTVDLKESMKDVLSKRPTPQDRNKIRDLYQFLVDNVEDVLDGYGKPHPHIVQLSKKMEEELCPSLDLLSPEDKNRIVLYSLKEKLLSRMRDMAVREMKLDNMEYILKPAAGEGAKGDKSDLEPPPLSENLWHDTISKFPKKRNLKLLNKAYSSKLVERFTEKLASEKRKIINKSRKHYNNGVMEMKKQMREAIKEELEEFIAARKEWNLVSAALRDVKMAKARHDKFMQQNKKKNKHSWKATVTNQLNAQTKESQKRYEEEMRRGEELRLMIQSERQNYHVTQSLNSNRMNRLIAENEELESRMEELQEEIKHHRGRMRELKVLCSL